MEILALDPQRVQIGDRHARARDERARPAPCPPRPTRPSTRSDTQHIDRFHATELSNPDVDLVVRRVLAVATGLHLNGHPADGLAVVRAALDAWSTTDPEHRSESLRDAHYFFAVCLGECGELERAADALQAFRERYRDLDTPQTHDRIANTFVFQAAHDAMLGRARPALELLDSAIARYQDDPGEKLRAATARALEMKATILDENGDNAAADRVREEIIDRFLDAPATSEPDVALTALYQRSSHQAEHRQRKAALAGLDQLLKLLATTDETPDRQLLQANAMGLRSAQLMRLRKTAARPVPTG